MLFNSFLYIFLFLPIVVSVYFMLSQNIHYSCAKIFLAIASLFFYGWWNPAYLPLLGLSILINYIIAHSLQITNKKYIKKIFLVSGIIFNLALLGYFKYANFFVDNINYALNSHVELNEITLPLGISFFSFTQIAFLINIYRNSAKRYGIVDYCLFVTYFPHLLAGPIIHHAQIIPQFSQKDNGIINYKNIYFGLLLFFIGLAKKVLLADTFAVLANNGYAHAATLDFTTAWVTSLAYTFQIYFDFSGYTDMAIGTSKLFNIELPINFNSPYQSLSIRDFWRRWHITLSHFLRDYLYIPLGGNKVSEINIYRNLLLTFILGGFWHGAGWTFILWGSLHGTALSIQRLFEKLNIALPKLIAWFITFNFINITWVFFRATSAQEALTVLSSMFSVTNVMPVNPVIIILLAIAALLSLLVPNSYKIIGSKISDSLILIPASSMLILLAIIVLEMGNSHEFIYFKF